jgi:DNA-directed RNA polymerase specialized sigma24 family protein
MFRSRNKHKTIDRVTEYASCKDFQEIFNEDMVGLHRLAFLLTADHAKAEQCFVAGLEASIHGNPVFRQWARAWSKRAIIQSAIKAIAPKSTRYGAIPEAAEVQWNENEIESIAAVVASWEPFERFVFVMAVLEGYGLRECAALLACSAGCDSCKIPRDATSGEPITSEGCFSRSRIRSPKQGLCSGPGGVIPPCAITSMMGHEISQVWTERNRGHLCCGRPCNRRGSY